MRIGGYTSLLSTLLDKSQPIEELFIETIAASLKHVRMGFVVFISLEGRHESAT